MAGGAHFAIFGAAGRGTAWRTGLNAVRASVVYGASALLIASCSSAPETPAAPMTAKLHYIPVTFTDLPGWNFDDPTAALDAFVRSCRVWAAQEPAAALGGAGQIYGTVADWRGVCAAAERMRGAGAKSIRAFFEAEFAILSVRVNQDEQGLFTGYYEPELKGSRIRGGPFQVALHKRPPDLVQVDLGRFRDDLKGRRIAGRVVDGRLDPYDTRARIVQGGFPFDDLAIAWIDDPVDAFFVQIQGSGRVVLDDGAVIRVGYDGQNGHSYTAIGRILVDRGALSLEDATLQGIRRWLAANPDAAAEIMNANRSYVFFEESSISDPGLGPSGTQGIPLTPERSLAVDPNFHPMGVPVWLDATAPNADPDGPDQVLRRLMVAQDTGGAIRGPIRGDVFWGFGDAAARIAGRMRHQGRLFVLIPRELAARQRRLP